MVSRGSVSQMLLMNIMYPVLSRILVEPLTVAVDLSVLAESSCAVSVLQ
jgi:hypothetical protein